MKKIILKISSIYIILAIFIGISQITTLAAAIGYRLTAPEDGWLRFDDDDPSIQYLGTWKTEKIPTNYQTTTHFTYTQGVMQLRFYGTKIRLIMNRSPAQSNGIVVTIDGNKYKSFSNYLSTTERTVLVFQETNLNPGFHTLSVVSTATGHMAIDAIDIDDTGYLVPYNKIVNLNATPGDSKVTLSWNAVEGATGYKITYGTISGNYTTTISPIANNTFSGYDITNLKNGTTYYFTVSAIINEGEYGTSDEASATPVTSHTPPSTVNKLKVVLEVAESLQLSINDDLAVNTQMAWTSSDNTIATVDGKGVVTALTPGNTVITVSSVDGTYTEKINILIVEDAKNYRLAVDLKVGESARITIDDLSDTIKATWVTMDSLKVNVSSKGKVTALSKGLVLITAKDEEGKIIGSVYVRVRE